MAKNRRVRKKLHKAELTAKVVRYEQTTLRMVNELASPKTPTEQLNAIRSILDLTPVTYQETAPKKSQVKHFEADAEPTQKAVKSADVKPTQKAVKAADVQPKVSPTDDAEQVTDLRLDVATTLYTYLCNQADIKDSSYDAVLVEQLTTFQAGTQELDTNDFADCDTKQRIYIQIKASHKEMIDALAKKLKLPKRAVVETICSTLIRKG